MGCAESHRPRLVWLLSLVLACSTGATHVCADSSGAPDYEAAARAYREAQAAQRAEKPAEAARWYELANSIAPTPQALRNAIRSHVAASQHARAATLALSAQVLYSDRETRGLVKGVLANSGSALARLTVKCGTPCELQCDGQAIDARQQNDFDVFIEPGKHLIAANFDSRDKVQHNVELGAGERLVLNLEMGSTPEVAKSTPIMTTSEFTPPPLPPTTVATTDSPVANGERGTPPWMFWGAAALTGAVGTAAVISAIDMANRHDTYLMDPTPEGYYGGIRSQRRTNLLLVGTGVGAALTVGLALFTDWEEGGTQLEPSVSPDGKASLTFRQRF